MAQGPVPPNPAPQGPVPPNPAPPGPVPPNPAPPAGVVTQDRRSNLRRVLVLTGVGVVIAGCAIAMLLILGFSIGVQALLVGLVAAILPVPVLVACFLWLDRYEPEPPWFLAIAFGWGACPATLTALGVNTLGSWVFDQVGLPKTLVAVTVAPVIEELMKALGPILLLLLSRREFSGITDGIVYCGLSAVGFAMVENILYLGGHGFAAGKQEYGPASGLYALFAIFLARILFTGFAHPLFTSMTGVGLGVAARSAERRVRWAAPIAGLLLAMILHGTWNLMSLLAVDQEQPFIMLYGYVGLMMPIFLGMVGLAIWLRAWEGRLTERILPQYVRAGWLTPPEVAALGSLGRRHSARRWARRVAGDAGLRAMRDFQAAATRLALLRDGLQRGLDSKPGQLAQAVAEERRLIEAIAAYRRVFVGRDPQAPIALWDGSRYHLTFPDGVRRSVDAPAEPVVPLPVVMAPSPWGYRR
ncbi:MAG: PrsW family intramembrane metalloprotease [Micromonosporaceae bacterium]|nr:PrsW family intramembrane metalloprotease [Micromonosporaceae bacterium]